MRSYEFTLTMAAQRTIRAFPTGMTTGDGWPVPFTGDRTLSDWTSAVVGVLTALGNPFEKQKVPEGYCYRLFVGPTTDVPLYSVKSIEKDCRIYCGLMETKRVSEYTLMHALLDEALQGTNLWTVQSFLMLQERATIAGICAMAGEMQKLHGEPNYVNWQADLQGAKDSVVELKRLAAHWESHADHAAKQLMFDLAIDHQEQAGASKARLGAAEQAVQALERNPPAEISSHVLEMQAFEGQMQILEKLLAVVPVLTQGRDKNIENKIYLTAKHQQAAVDMAVLLMKRVEATPAYVWKETVSNVRRALMPGADPKHAFETLKTATALFMDLRA